MGEGGWVQVCFRDLFSELFRCSYSTKKMFVELIAKISLSRQVASTLFRVVGMRLVRRSQSSVRDCYDTKLSALPTDLPSAPPSLLPPSIAASAPMLFPPQRRRHRPLLPAARRRRTPRCGCRPSCHRGRRTQRAPRRCSLPIRAGGSSRAGSRLSEAPAPAARRRRAQSGAAR